jgi:Fe-S cluster assembly protein SufD
MTTLQSNILENHTPTGREEAWRFTPLKRLGGMHDGTATPVERNSLAAKGALPKGATFTHQEIIALTQTDDAIVNRIREFTSKGAVLEVAANAEISEPIFLNRTSFGTDSAEF